MTKTFWTIVAVVVVMLGIAAGVIYRSQLTGMFASAPAPEPVATTTPSGPTWLQYATTTFSVQYPPGYTLNAAYAYDQFGQNKLIAGVSFTIPQEMATGTNLGSDTRVSVEQLPRAKNCTADIFIPADVKAQKVSDNGVQYSLASTTGAGAGNRYEEVVYALVGSSPCTAVRYWVHSSVLENYPAGAVRAFDRAQLLSEFDQVRKSVSLGSSPTSTQP